MDKDQLVEIEMKLSYQERLLSDLNTIVYDQQKTIDKLVKNIEKLRRDFLEISDSLSTPLSKHEKPPHY